MKISVLEHEILKREYNKPNEYEKTGVYERVSGLLKKVRRNINVLTINRSIVCCIKYERGLSFWFNQKRDKQ